MSYYEGLPIYRAAMNTALVIEGEVRSFGRFHKYQLGSRLRDLAFDCVRLVAAAQRRTGRLEALDALCDAVADLQVSINFGREVGAFASIKRAVGVMEQVVVLARQAEGWRKSVAAQRPRVRGDSPKFQGPEPVRTGVTQP